MLHSSLSNNHVKELHRKKCLLYTPAKLNMHAVLNMFWTKDFSNLQLFAMISIIRIMAIRAIKCYFGYQFQVWRAETSPDLGGPSPEVLPAIMEKMIRDNPVREALRWLLGSRKFWEKNPPHFRVARIPGNPFFSFVWGVEDTTKQLSLQYQINKMNTGVGTPFFFPP